MSDQPSDQMSDQSSDQMSDQTSDQSMPGWVKWAIVWFWAGGLASFYLVGMIRALGTLMIVVLVSLFLSFAIEPAVNRMERRGIKRGYGTTIAFVVITLGMLGFAMVVGAALSSQITEFVDDSPRYIDRAENWVNETFNTNYDFNTVRDEFIEGGGVQDLAGRFADDVVNIGATAISLVFHLFTVALFTFYLAAEGPKLRRLICSFLDERRQRMVLHVWDLALDRTGGYIYSRSVLALLSLLSHWLAFILIDVPHPLALALWVGVISQFIPVVGTYLAGVLPVLIALLDEPSSAIWTLAMILIYQQLENYIWAPRVTAETMEIHAAVAFGSVIAGAALLGVVGALLSLPFAATTQAFISSYAHRHVIDEEAFANPNPDSREDHPCEPQDGEEPLPASPEAADSA